MLLSVHTFASLDGVIQGPAASEEDRSSGFDRGGWLVPLAEEMGDLVDSDWFAHADALLLGRTTYQLMQPYWSAVTDPDNLTATVLNGHPKYVVSTTLTPETATWEKTEVISDNVLDRVAELKATPRGELQVHGSWQLVQSLHQAGLVDLFRMLIFPVVVGSGKRLFDEGTPPTGFKVASQKFAGRLVALELEPVEYTTGEVGVTEDGREVI